MSLLSPTQRKNTTYLKVHVDENNAINKFATAFSEILSQQNLTLERPKVIVCIGTDRSTGDSLGPLVGTKLKESNHKFFKVFGTLDDPVHATNLKEYLEIINDLPNPFVIAVDASLGRLDNVGAINIKNGALKPGAGVNKDLPQVGNLHITGVVNVGGFMEYLVLQNTRLNIVMKMATIISEGINRSVWYMSRYSNEA